MIERVAQVGWVLDHLDDIASDMSVFHRVDDVTTLDGVTFFRLAYRLPAYRGVLRERVLAENTSSTPSQEALHSVGHSRSRQDINPGARATLMAEPAFSGVFSFG